MATTLCWAAGTQTYLGFDTVAYTITKDWSGPKARVGHEVQRGRRGKQLMVDLGGILIIHVGTSATAVECSDLTSRPTGLCGGRTNMAMTNMAMSFGRNHA